ncbi:MAG: gamma-glutamyltransferase [Acidobacteria bacterium]|nr:gamma-glutamyltransferase [Acidobacteriota bacterium]
MALLLCGGLLAEGPPTEISRKGMVAAATPEASRAGAQILAAGGNAVDAAVATAFALAVTYPQAGNLTGGGFLVLRRANGELHALDFRESGPAAVWRDTFAAPGTSSWKDGLAVATPASVRGLEEAHRRFGRMPWRKVLAPAIQLAADGFLVPQGLVTELVDKENRDLLSRNPESLRVFFPGGDAIRVGSRFVQPDLARTLQAIAREGADGFHRGEIARRVSAFVQATGGVLTEGDLAGYRPVWRAPLSVDRGRDRIVTMSLPSSGGFLLAHFFGQLGFVPGSLAEPFSPGTLHLMAEVERRAFADRNRFLGDPSCVDVPLARLLAPARLAELGAAIDVARATSSKAVVGLERAEREETTHVSVATADGEAVAMTTTLNGTFGNGAIVPGVGVLLNNEMDDFATRPGQPNYFGLVQGDSNAVRAGGRPLSSMTPTIVLRDGRVRWVLGSPGGSTIPTTVLQVYLHVATRGTSLADAVAAPRFHHQHLPDQISLERGGFSAEVQGGLAKLGHTLVERRPIGNVQAIEVLPDGRLVGVSDPRGYGRPSAPAP